MQLLNGSNFTYLKSIQSEYRYTFFNGAKRVRTADPYNAIVVLYQLSYNPVFFA
jgi:hypothetical protein